MSTTSNPNVPQGGSRASKPVAPAITSSLLLVLASGLAGTGCASVMDDVPFDPCLNGGPGCSTTEVACDDFYDDDGDGLVDCIDPDCFSALACVQEDPTVESSCNDGLDSDADGLTDCLDPDCFANAACTVGAPMLELACSDGLDDDGDGSIDCADADCSSSPACLPTSMEICANAADDDGDGLSDCDDPDCTGATACSAVPIANIGSAILLSGSIDGDEPTWDRPYATCTVGTTGVADHYYDVFTVANMTGLTQVIDLTATWNGGDGYLHVFTTPFDPADMTLCIAGDDDFEGLGGSQLTGVVMAAGDTFSIVASTFGGGAIIGSYTISVDTE